MSSTLSEDQYIIYLFILFNLFLINVRFVIFSMPIAYPINNNVCLQGMIALRRNATEVTHEDLMEAINEVQAKKKANLNYYA